MLMPIVSMNKMAMNESIAVTCCYRQVATPTAVYWEVLNGGWIGSGYVTQKVWNTDDGVGNLSSDALKFWLQFPYDVKPLGTTASANNMPSYDNTNTLGWNLNGVKVGQLDTANGDPWMISKACDHTAITCNYWTEDNRYTENQHFESKTAHASITKWAAPHDAEQWSS